MPREEVRPRTERRVEQCPSCHIEVPNHMLWCPQARGLHCEECEALLPRHYPHCSIGIRFGFYGWQLSRYDQRHVEEMFNHHMRQRIESGASRQ